MIERKSTVEKYLSPEMKSFRNNKIREGFYIVSHPDNPKSVILVKIDSEFDDIIKLKNNNPDVFDKFIEISKDRKLVGGSNKQEYKFAYNGLELKILGANGKSDFRLFGKIIKDKDTGVKYFVLSKVINHKSLSR